ncbi:MAG TPA: peptidoglycan recognition family protein [Candidatus Angelobacter sp.]|jgi:N-acetyl-anhydromuramyl-L-alanine amidase AmpD
MEKRFIGCALTNFRKGRHFNQKPEAIVIHIAVGSLRSVDVWFKNGKSGVSAHYCVGKKGQIHQYVDEADTAFHAGTVDSPSWELIKPHMNPNDYTIGIEHEGMPDDVWPDLQLIASAGLVGEIVERWNIPLDSLHVVMHRQIRSSKTCPGNFITIEKILSRVPPLTLGTGTLTTAVSIT